MEETKLPLADLEEQEESPPADTINEEQSLPAEDQDHRSTSPADTDDHEKIKSNADKVKEEQSLKEDDEAELQTYAELHGYLSCKTYPANSLKAMMTWWSVKHASHGTTIVVVDIQGKKRNGSAITVHQRQKGGSIDLLYRLT